MQPSRSKDRARDSKKTARREIFVLTSEEKATICFLLIAFVLGLATKCYRGRHPVPTLTLGTTATGYPTPKQSAAGPR